MKSESLRFLRPEFFRYFAVYVENFAKFVPIWPEFWLSTLTFFLTKGPVLRFTISYSSTFGNSLKYRKVLAQIFNCPLCLLHCHHLVIQITHNSIHLLCNVFLVKCFSNLNCSLDINLFTQIN